jgi:hypothetical protein
MDLFLAGSQGLGLALAAGALAGAPGRPGSFAVSFAIAGAAAGAVASGLSLEAEDPSATVPGVVVGGLAASLSWWVASDVGAGARGREQVGAGVAFFVVLYALALAGLSLAVPPVALFALIITAWLAIGRQRREARKYEGLRSLR